MHPERVLIRVTRPDGSHVTLRLPRAAFDALRVHNYWQSKTLHRTWTEVANLPWPPEDGSWKVVSD